MLCIYDTSPFNPLQAQEIRHLIARRRDRSFLITQAT